MSGAGRHIALDPCGGIAGDMFAASLIDVFPDLAALVTANLDKAGLPAGISATIAPARSGGFRAARFVVEGRGSTVPPRTLAEVTNFIDNSRLSPAVQGHLKGLFDLLAAAEGSVHGQPHDQVHFHEVSDWDSMVDFVAAATIADGLAGADWSVGPLPLGRGRVMTAHGSLPLPAPAVLELLRGYEMVDDGIPGERVTPTGAAILRHLAPCPREGATRGRLVGTGVGCGSRRLPGTPNILRALVFATDTRAPGLRDRVIRLAFEVDDMTGEECARALDALRQQQGILDVASVPMQGKKGRPCLGVRILARPECAEAALEACFEWTTTLGVRTAAVERRLLDRRGIKAAGGVTVKVARRPGGRTAKAESDDLATASTLFEQRRRAGHAERAALGTGTDDA